SDGQLQDPRWVVCHAHEGREDKSLLGISNSGSWQSRRRHHLHNRGCAYQRLSSRADHGRRSRGFKTAGDSCKKGGADRLHSAPTTAQVWAYGALWRKRRTPSPWRSERCVLSVGSVQVESRNPSQRKMSVI